MKNKEAILKPTFLCLTNWNEISLEESGSEYLVKAIYKSPEVPDCPHCAGNEFNNKHGLRTRRLKDSPVRGKVVTITLSIQRYSCSRCNQTFTENVPDLIENSRFTKRLVFYIIKACLNRNFSEISRETAVSEGSIRRIFSNLVLTHKQLFNQETPRVIGVGYATIGRVSRCLLTNLEKQKPFDIVSKSNRESLFDYLRNMENNNKAEIFVVGLHNPFREAVRSAMPDAKIVVDKFHIYKLTNDAIRNFLKVTRKSLNTAERRHLMRDPFLLLKRPSKLKEKEQIDLANWKKDWLELAEVYDLKEAFFEIWQNTDRKAAESTYDSWKSGIPGKIQPVFADLIDIIDNWHEEIFNYFDYKFTNAYTDSCKSLLNLMHSESRGFDFETLRLKFLFQQTAHELTEAKINFDILDK